MQNQQQSDVRKNINSVIALFQLLALLFEAWWRVPGRCGSRFFSGRAFIGWLIFLVIAAFSRSPVLLQLWLLTGLWMLLHKIVHGWHRLRGYHPHSLFVGVSWLSFVSGNWVAIRFLEPLVTFVAGLLLIQSGYSFGVLFTWGGIALYISAAYMAAQERAQITAMQDARANQEWLTEHTQR